MVKQMPPVDLTDALVIAVSARALFDLSASHQIFLESGLSAYRAHQIEHENDVLSPGPGFALVKALLSLNESAKRPVEVIVMSHNSADTSMRIFNSIEAHGLDIARAGLTSGSPLAKYLQAYSTDLFLSATETDVVEASKSGIAAARVYDNPILRSVDSDSDEIRIAFDGDAVLFSNESEQIFQAEGLEAFQAYERSRAKEPMKAGPLYRVLKALHDLKSTLPAGDKRIRVALITTRDNHTVERVIRTLRAWEIDIDEAFFMGGVSKTEIIKAFGAQIFFDDQDHHCRSASDYVAAAQVPSPS